MSEFEIYSLLSDFKDYYNYDVVETRITNKKFTLIVYKNGQKVKEVKIDV